MWTAFLAVMILSCLISSFIAALTAPRRSILAVLLGRGSGRRSRRHFGRHATPSNEITTQSAVDKSAPALPFAARKSSY